MKKFSLFVMLLLFFAFVTFPEVTVVDANYPSIKIRADGTVEGTNKIKQEGNFYYLTDDIEVYSQKLWSIGISVQKDNIILDGNNFSLVEKGNIEEENTISGGIGLSNVKNVTIQNFNITGFSIGVIFGPLGDLSTSAKAFSNTIVGNTIVVAEYPFSIQAGIWVGPGASDNKIVDNYITGSSHEGIYLYKSNCTYLSGNEITKNKIGLRIGGSDNNVLRNNKIYDNHENIQLDSSVSESIQDIDTSNTVNNKPVCYWVNQHNKTVPSDAGFVALGNCSGITVQDLNITNSGIGVFLDSTTDSVLKNNHLENNGFGIQIRRSQQIKITDNSLKNNDSGILVLYSYNVTTSKNHITGNFEGIRLLSEKNVSVLNNNITNNSYGIFLVASENVISGNNFTGNTVFGIYILNAHSNLIVGNSFIENNCPALRLSTSINNTFYHNNFIDNHVESGLQVLNPWLLGSGDTETNTWDNGYEGNYWSDYALRYPKANQLNSSGIWNRQYFINEVNIDRFPLTEPFTINKPAPDVPDVSDIPDVVSDFPIWIPLTIVLVLFTALAVILLFRRRKLHPPLKKEPN